MTKTPELPQEIISLITEFSLSQETSSDQYKILRQTSKAFKIAADDNSKWAINIEYYDSESFEESSEEILEEFKPDKELRLVKISILGSLPNAEDFAKFFKKFSREDLLLKLDLRHYSLDDEYLSQLFADIGAENCKKICSINLSDGSEVDLSIIANACPNLQDINIHASCNLNLEALKAMPQLQSISLDGKAKDMPSLDEGIQIASDHPVTEILRALDPKHKLQSLSLSNCKITSSEEFKIIMQHEALSELKSLNLSVLRLPIDSIADAIKDRPIQNLKIYSYYYSEHRDMDHYMDDHFLGFSMNQEGALAKLVTNLPQLRNLDLSNTPISDEALCSIPKRQVPLHLELGTCPQVTDQALKTLLEKHGNLIEVSGRDNWKKIKEDSQMFKPEQKPSSSTKAKSDSQIGQHRDPSRDH